MANGRGPRRRNLALPDIGAAPAISREIVGEPPGEDGQKPVPSGVSRVAADELTCKFDRRDGNKHRVGLEGVDDAGLDDGLAGAGGPQYLPRSTPELRNATAASIASALCTKGALGGPDRGRRGGGCDQCEIVVQLDVDFGEVAGPIMVAPTSSSAVAAPSVKPPLAITTRLV